MLEVPIGKDLKQKYGLGYRERLRLEVKGKPKWDGDQGQLELSYDEIADPFRVIQPASDCSRHDSPRADETATLDIGANNLIAYTTPTGTQLLYERRDLFEQFQEAMRRIAELQSKLREGHYSSKQIRRLYRRRNHPRDALVRDLIERLYGKGISTVYVGDFTDVLSADWSVRMNAWNTQKLCIFAFIDPTRVHCRGIRNYSRERLGSVDKPRVSKLWQAQCDGSP